LPKLFCRNLEVDYVSWNQLFTWTHTSIPWVTFGHQRSKTSSSEYANASVFWTCILWRPTKFDYTCKGHQLLIFYLQSPFLTPQAILFLYLINNLKPYPGAGESREDLATLWLNSPWQNSCWWLPYCMWAKQICFSDKSRLVPIF
jgi:hypothetical protein